MLKFVVSALSVASAFGRPETPFTLREPNQMAHLSERGHPMPHLLGHPRPPPLDNVPFPVGDPKPERPKPSPPSDKTKPRPKAGPEQVLGLVKPVPIVPLQHSRPRPAGIRALHEDRDHHHGDDDRDHGDRNRHHGDDDRAFPFHDTREPGPRIMGKPAPGMMGKPAPRMMDKPESRTMGKPDPRMMGKPSPDMKPKPQPTQPTHDDIIVPANTKPQPKVKPLAVSDPTPPPLIGGMKPKAKPSPPGMMTGGMMGKPKPSPSDMMTRGMKPKPKPSPPGMMTGSMKPKPKAKPSFKSFPPPPPFAGRGSEGSISGGSIDMMADEAQQQCQMDYARLCSPSAGFRSIPLTGMPLSRPSPRDMDTFFVDVILVNQEPVDVNMPDVPDMPCGTKASLDQNDDQYDDQYDDAYDDDEFEDDLYKFKTPVLDMMQTLFSGLRLTRPTPRPIPMDAIPMPMDAMPSVSSASFPRKLWAQSQTFVSQDYIIKDEEEFPLALGFGSEGDMCMLDNFERLSPSCQDSIDDLTMMIDDFDMDDEEGCPVMPFVLILLVFILAVRCIARRRMVERRDSIQTTLAAIHASPELKAKVEAASGMPLPPTLPACRSRMAVAMADQAWYVKLLYVLGMFTVSLLIVANAMLITGAIVNGIYMDQDEDPSPVVVLLLLFSVLTLEVMLVKRLQMAICAYLASPSAPTTASSGTEGGSSPSPSNSGGGGVQLPQIFQRMRAVQLTSLLPARFSSPSSPSGPQYQPLLSEEDYEEQEQHRGNTEMMLVSASAPPSSSAPVSTIPVVVAPVGYAPSNVQSSISMF